MDDLKLLVDQAKAGDKNAFAGIYRQFYNAIRKYAHFNLKKKEEADDIAQNTFIKAWQALPKFSWHHDKSLQAFLYKIARNHIIDLSRRKPVADIDDIPEIPKEDNLLDALAEEEQRTSVQKLLLQLSDWERQLVTWRFWDELSYQQIAKRTHQNTEALRVALHRALRKLKRSGEHLKKPKIKNQG